MIGLRVQLHHFLPLEILNALTLQIFGNVSYRGREYESTIASLEAALSIGAGIVCL